MNVLLKCGKIVAEMLLILGLITDEYLLEPDIRRIAYGSSFVDHNGIPGLTTNWALDSWFDSDLEWSCYQEDDVTYVEACGYTEYGLDGREWQKFVFEEDMFLGAYNKQGCYIWTDEKKMLEDVEERDAYNLAVQAALGDFSAMQEIEKKINENAN